MNVKKIVVGDLDTNCYVLQIDQYILVIDPGGDADKIISSLTSKVLGVIVTHYHNDHIGALETILQKYNCPCYDFHNLKEGQNSIGPFLFNVIFTPGHKEDCISIYFEKEAILFCGDFIFKSSIGRTDLLGGNSKDMKESIDAILRYPENTLIYPGHYESTYLNNERANLEYFKSII